MNDLLSVCKTGTLDDLLGRFTTYYLQKEYDKAYLIACVIRSRGLDYKCIPTEEFEIVKEKIE